MDWKFVLMLIFSVFVAIFAIQNANPVDIQFLTLEFLQVSQAIVILISAAFGALIVLLISAVRWVKDKTKLKNATRTISSLEMEIKQLKGELSEETARSENLANAAKAASETKVVSESIADTEPAVLFESNEVAEAPQENRGLEDEAEKTENTTPKRKWYQL